MAQLVARAMARADLSADDKQLIDRLAAEYAAELNNLGVRVADLEAKSDNVRIGGLLRLDARQDKVTGKKTKETVKARLRLEPQATVNADWTIKSRIDFDSDLKNGGTDTVKLKMAYATGPLLGTNFSVGQIDYVDFENMNAAYGLLFDTYMSGAKAVFGDATKITLAGGRMGKDNNAWANLETPFPEDYIEYLGAQVESRLSDSFTLGLAYHALDSDHYYKDQNIWEVAADYKLTPQVKLGGAYAKSGLDAKKMNYSGYTDSDEDRAYTIQLDYKGVKRSVPGTFGLWAAYRSLGVFATVLPTYVSHFNGERGYEVGAKYMFDKNLMGQLIYFDGEKISDDKDVKRVFGRLELRF